MRKAILIGLLTVGAFTTPVNADGVTPTEESAEACEELGNLKTFGNGDFDNCYDNYLTYLSDGKVPVWQVPAPVVLTELPRTF